MDANNDMSNSAHFNWKSCLRWLGVVLLTTVLAFAPKSLVRAQPVPDNRPHVLVLIDTNLRAGPGMTQAVVGRAVAGDVYLVLDQAQACSWLQVAASGDAARAPLGWISGHSAYVELTISCAEIGAAAPHLPTPTPVTAVEVDASVSVLIDGAALRAAPSVVAGIVRTTAAGETFDVVGQVGECKWLHVIDADGAEGWISGNPAYSQMSNKCDAIASEEPPTPTPAPVPHLTVLLDDVNIRAAASTRADILRTATLDEVFVVTGQTNNCTWYQIALDAPGEVGWISGNQAYTQVDQACATLVAIAPTPTPRPTATVSRAAQGCATVTNQLGFTVRIDIERGDGWQTSFSLAPGASRYACVEPGTYTATLSSPARSDRFSAPLFVRGGENYNIPLQMP